MADEVEEVKQEEVQRQHYQLIIDQCDVCSYFDNFYHDYAHRCSVLDRVIEGEFKTEADKEKGWMDPDYYPPEDCPLEKTDLPVTLRPIHPRKTLAQYL